MGYLQLFWRHSLKFIAFIFLLFPTLAFSAQGTLNVITFNILAPCWASPALYPASSAPLLDREFRRARIIAFLKAQADNTDIFTLQETTQVELSYINDAMKSKFDMYAAYHSPSYWLKWQTVTPPWEPNGVAILVKKNTLINPKFTDTPLTDDGNHGALLSGYLKSNPSQAIRIASIHLDSDRSYNRERELKSLLDKMPPNSNTIDIIGGDFNFEVTNGNLKNNLESAGFKDILTTLGRDGNTSPYSSTYYNSSNYGDIDHVLVRNAIPVDGMIFSFDLYRLYPSDRDEENRINANFNITGSDHFPVSGIAKP